MIKYAPVTTSITRRRHLTGDYYSLTFGPMPSAARCRPGQFVHIRLPNSQIYFRRAMSIASVDVEKQELEIIFRVCGRGTTLLSGCPKDGALDILGPLGGSFSTPRKGETALLIGGGIGFPPLMYHAAELIRSGFDPGKVEFFYGGRTADDILEQARIKRLKLRFHPVTEDGSLGAKGLVTKAVLQRIENAGSEKFRIFSCGPEGMLKAVDDLGMRLGIPGEVSLEAPMPCGYGVCLGCVVPLRAGGHARVCQEGPVFQIGEVLL